MFMRPNARISVMGGEQAAGVLSDVRRGAAKRRGEAWDDEADAAYKEDIRAQYDAQGSPYYSSARLWDDGIIDPVDTRDVLGLCLSASTNAPVEETRFGVFRM